MRAPARGPRGLGSVRQSSWDVVDTVGKIADGGGIQDAIDLGTCRAQMLANEIPVAERAEEVDLSHSGIGSEFGEIGLEQARKLSSSRFRNGHRLGGLLRR